MGFHPAGGTMKRSLILATVLSLSSPVALANAQATATTAPVVVDLMKDVSGVGEKLIALAKAIPEDKYSWRPAPGVRSIDEVLKHVAADNYLLPIPQGTAADPTTGITSDYKTVQAYETRKASRDEVIAHLEKSFAHLSAAMAKTTSAQLSGSFKFFGQDFTSQGLWIMTTTHLHEHLGQMIAYARSNGIKPPWSR
jgi:uncharacterized damage-inducible protein DinB